MVVTASDALTVVFEFDKPHGIFLEKLCYRGHYIYKPKHYLKQFHLKYADEAQLQAKVKKAGFNHWAQLFKNR